MRTVRRLLRRPGAGWLALAAALAGLAVVFTARSMSTASAGTPVLVARVAVPAGTLLGERVAAEALSAAPVPDGLDLAGLLHAPSEAIGRRTAVPLAAGEPVTEAALGGAPGVGPGPLRAGERAVPVPLSAAGGAAAGLAPGSRVDVAASSGEGAAARTAVVVSDAEVLAVGADPGGGVGTEGASALLRVSAGGALRLTSALNFARDVRLLVRPLADSP